MISYYFFSVNALTTICCGRKQFNTFKTQCKNSRIKILLAPEPSFVYAATKKQHLNHTDLSFLLSATSEAAIESDMMH